MALIARVPMKSIRQQKKMTRPTAPAGRAIVFQPQIAWGCNHTDEPRSRFVSLKSFCCLAQGMAAPPTSVGEDEPRPYAGPAALHHDAQATSPRCLRRPAGQVSFVSDPTPGPPFRLARLDCMEYDPSDPVDRGLKRPKSQSRRRREGCRLRIQ